MQACEKIKWQNGMIITYTIIFAMTYMRTITTVNMNSK